MKKYFLIATIAVAVIYIMSNMTYQQQSIVPILQTYLASKPFEQVISSIEFMYIGDLISVDTMGYFYFLEFLIRKATHFFGYGFVGVIFYGIFRHLRTRLPALFAVITITIIASLDEYLQSGTPGRTGTSLDVMLDVAGAIFCITVFSAILILTRGTTKVLKR
ncbi:MAG: VanZ family protein [Lysinibacillus sp.]